MSALNDKMVPERVEEWHGPTTVSGVIKMLSATPQLGPTDKERVRAWLTAPGSKYLPASLRADLERYDQSPAEEEPA